MQRCQAGARGRYWLTLVSGMLECLCFAGVMFGFASLMFVLKEERYFSQLCSSVPGSNSSQGSTGGPRPPADEPRPHPGSPAHNEVALTAVFVSFFSALCRLQQAG